jgi:signal transduction histidine kinase
MFNSIKNHLLSITIFLISLLMLSSIVLVHYKSKVIDEERQLYYRIEVLKLNTDLLISWVIHDSDLGVWAYYISEDKLFLNPHYDAFGARDSVFFALDQALKSEKIYFDKFQSLKIIITDYLNFNTSQLHLLEVGQIDQFEKRFREKRGVMVVEQVAKFRADVYEWCEKMKKEVQMEHDRAVNKTYFSLIALCILGVPTLVFTAFYTQKTFVFLEKLQKLEKEKRIITEKQNDALEQAVKERTYELEESNEELKQQSEEIQTQRDLLAKQNQKMQEIQNQVQQKNVEIQQQNQILEEEVIERTQELSETNQELAEYNRQLEQYSFVTAHNLRAPVARILGLGNLLEMNTISHEEKIYIAEKMVENTKQLDSIIKDLNLIFEIKRKDQLPLSHLFLPQIITKAKDLLSKELYETDGNIITFFQKEKYVYGFLPYVESIFYNLINNAIKYKYPFRRLLITISAEKVGGYVKVSVQDNGMGIDLDLYKDKIFNMYKRFHLQVEGKGMGLFLVKTQIESLGGRIEVESTPEQGTTFHVYFKES